MADSSSSAREGRPAEVVSPILRYENSETLQEVIRTVRRIGASVGTSGGIHVGVARFDVKALGNLIKIVNKQGGSSSTPPGIGDARRARWCRGVVPDVLARG